jgi:hypothetical protein
MMERRGTAAHGPRRGRGWWLSAVSCLLASACPGTGLRAQEVSSAPAAAASTSGTIGSARGLEERRYLLYLYARLNRADQAEVLASEILKDNPADKQVLLTMASMYLDRKDSVNTHRQARAVLKYYPKDRQGLYFLAAGYALAGQHTESKVILRELKARTLGALAFEFQTDLAAELLASGDWFRAAQAYRELLRRPQLSDDLRAQAREVLEEIYRQRLPQAELATTGVLLGPGLVFRSRLAYSAQVEDRHRFETDFSHQRVTLDGGQGVKPTDADVYDGRVGVGSVWNERWRTSVSAGWAETEATGAASVTRVLGPQREITVSFKGSEHATDGLLLEALDGRQHRLTLEPVYAFDHRWTFSAQAGVRAVRLGADAVGEGYSVSWNLERQWFRVRPDLRVSYRGLYAGNHRSLEDERPVAALFDPGATGAQRRAILENLILPYFHREGLYVSWGREHSRVVSYHATAGAEYAFELGSVVHSVEAGLKVYPRRSVELGVSGMYLSNARTSDLNSDEWQFTVALRCWF